MRMGGMLLTESSNIENPVRLGLLNGGSTFFLKVQDGFKHACEHFDYTCYVAAHINGNTTAGNACTFRDLTVKKWMQELDLDAMAGVPCGPLTNNSYIDDAWNQGIPFVTFDKDVVNSSRIAYVGTDNFALGQTMARLLKQLRPEGGLYSIVGRKEGRTDGFEAEIMKDNNRTDRAHWYPTEEIPHGTGMAGYNNSMRYYSQQTSSDAIVSFKQTPMKNPQWKEIVDAARHKGITYLGVDSADYQLEYLNQKYVDGLVGQSQWGMGTKMVEVLHQYLTEGKLDRETYPTNLIAYNLIPTELPTLAVDQNLIGGLKWLGISFFIVIALVSIMCIGWSLRCRSAIVVSAAQPFFLIMVAVGVLVMSASLIPLSMNDDGDIQSLNDTERVAICMGVPWCCFLGFAVGT
ncbi:MAG: hypothetical protein SGILL_001796 [Bacillariaceae sp.]